MSIIRCVDHVEKRARVTAKTFCVFVVRSDEHAPTEHQPVDEDEALSHSAGLGLALWLRKL